MNVPPYIPENLKADFPELKQAADVIRNAYMQKVTEQLKEANISSKTGLLITIQTVFEAGFMAGASFIKDNPDL